VGRFARGVDSSNGSLIRGKGAGQSSQRKKGGEQGNAAIHVLSSEPRLVSRGYQPLLAEFPKLPMASLTAIKSATKKYWHIRQTSV
jgi:hypothetical protein